MTLGGDVGETHRDEEREELAPEAVVDAAGEHDLWEDDYELERGFVRECGGVETGGDDVELLEHEVAAGLECRDEALDGALALGEVDEDEARVRDVEGVVVERVGEDVMSADLDVGGGDVSRKRVLRSVTSTWPVAPTRSLIQRAIDPEPPPTSRQCAPVTTKGSRWRMVTGSKRASRAPKRCSVSAAALSKM